MTYVWPLATAFAFAYGLTWLVRLIAPRLGLVDAPRQDRWHRRPVPRLGGVAIYLAFILAWWVNGHAIVAREAYGLLIGGAAIFVVGLIDDLFHLENRPKLILLLLCSLIPFAWGIRFELLPALLGAPLAIVWILGATNAFNWLDNMDGVAGGIAAIAALTLAAFSIRTDGGAVAPLALILAGAAVGFLVHNFPPARIFMGDGGSGFLGFTLATLAVMGSYKGISNVFFTVLAPGLMLAVPIFDTVMVSLLRTFNRRSIFQGGRDHPAHRLVTMGLPERKVVLLLYGLSIMAGTAALAASSLSLLAGIAVSVILILMFLALGLVLAEVHVYDAAQRPHQAATRLPRPFANKKWILLMFLDMVLVSIAYVSAYLLRYEGGISPRVTTMIVQTLPLMLGAKMVGLYLLGAYRGAWRYAGVLDIARLVMGVTVGSLIGTAVLFLWTRLEDFPRSVLVLDWMLATMFVGGSRFSLRFVREYLLVHGELGARALIFGAGRGGTLLLQEIRQNPALRYQPVGFVDDDPSMRGTIVRGLPVLGTRRDLVGLIARHRVEEVLLATPSVPPDVLEEILGVCAASGVRARRVEMRVD